MSKPSRPVNPDFVSGQQRTFFVTTRTAGGRSLLQTDRMASLLVDVLRTNLRAGRFVVHDFVIMPNHFHVLLTVPGGTSVERAAQWIKGGFSFRARKELGFRGDIWQRGFSDERINSEGSFREHQEYIAQNPVKAGLAREPEEYPCRSVCLKARKYARAKAQVHFASPAARLKSCPDTSCSSGDSSCKSSGAKALEQTANPCGTTEVVP
jgi:putative transposase